MSEKAERKSGLRAAAAALLILLVLFTGQVRAELKPSDLIESAFRMLEKGNPFVKKYQELTGKKIKTLFKYGVPYYFGGLANPKGGGYFFCAYPDYHVQTCTRNAGYYRKGKRYFYGTDCSGFIKYVYKSCGKQQTPSLSDILIQYKYRPNHIYNYLEGHKPPAYDRLKDTLQVGDLLVIKHQSNSGHHVMMYIGTLRDFGYTAESEPSLARWLDYPLVIHCGLSPFYGERFQKLIDRYPEKYGRATTTDGGVAVSIYGVKWKKAPEHGHVQKTDYAWFTMNDGGYQLSVINMSDVNYWCWYRQP